MDVQMVMIVFAIVIIGGAGSIGGAFLASTMIGVAEALAVPILPEFAEVLMYVVVAIVLLFRPQGLFGKSAG
jgi:branched-chain amino acid transport system permease protein